MSYDTEEQQIEKLKEWWSENGTPLIVGAILGLAGFAGWKYWNEKQVASQEAASDLYVKVTEILKSDNKADLAESAQAVKKQFPDSSYAILSALHLAKLAVDANELDKATAELTWIIDKHPTNDLSSIAKIRLARVFIQQDKATEALSLVEVDAESGYHALSNLVKGDALFALERKTEALAAYKVAVSDLEVVSRHPSLQFKIDQLSAPASSIAINASTTEQTSSNGKPESVLKKTSEETNTNKDNETSKDAKPNEETK